MQSQHIITPTLIYAIGWHITQQHPRSSQPLRKAGWDSHHAAVAQRGKTKHTAGADEAGEAGAGAGGAPPAEIEGHPARPRKAQPAPLPPLRPFLCTGRHPRNDRAGAGSATKRREAGRSARNCAEGGGKRCVAQTHTQARGSVALEARGEDTEETSGPAEAQAPAHRNGRTTTSPDTCPIPLSQRMGEGCAGGDGTAAAGRAGVTPNAVVSPRNALPHRAIPRALGEAWGCGRVHRPRAGRGAP